MLDLVELLIGAFELAEIAIEAALEAAGEVVEAIADIESHPAEKKEERDEESHGPFSG